MSNESNVCAAWVHAIHVFRGGGGVTFICSVLGGFASLATAS